MTACASALLIAAGWFSVTTGVDGVSTFVRPDGTPTFLIGVEHLFKQQPHEWENPNWEDDVVRNLTAWNFNFLGAGPVPALRTKGLPYSVIAWLSEGLTTSGDSDDAIFPMRGTHVPCSAFPNVFSPKWPASAAKMAKAAAASVKDDPDFVGYDLDNELKWWGAGAFGNDTNGLFCAVAALPETHSARRALAEFVRARQTTVADAPEAVRRAFVAEICERFFRVATEALRKEDPNHLILGIRFAGLGGPREAWVAAGKYCDVVSFNVYPWVDLDANWVKSGCDFWNGRDLRTLVAARHTDCGRPMLVTEWGTSAIDSGLPCLRAVGERFRTQKERTRAAAAMLGEFASWPFCVGASWFRYRDNVPNRGGNWEDCNWGLVDLNGTPYPQLTKMFTQLNPTLLEKHRAGTRLKRRESGDRGFPRADAARAKLETGGRERALEPVALAFTWRKPDGGLRWTLADRETGAFVEPDGARVVTNEARTAGFAAAVVTRWRAKGFDNAFFGEVVAVVNLSDAPVTIESLSFRHVPPFASVAEPQNERWDQTILWKPLRAAGWVAPDGAWAGALSAAPLADYFGASYDAQKNYAHALASFRFTTVDAQTPLVLAPGAIWAADGRAWALFAVGTGGKSGWLARRDAFERLFFPALGRLNLEPQAITVREEAFETAFSGTKFRVTAGPATVSWRRVAAVPGRDTAVITTEARMVRVDACPFLSPGLRPVQGPGAFVVRLADLDGHALEGRFDLTLDAVPGRGRAKFSCPLAREMRFSVTNALYRFAEMTISLSSGPTRRRLALTGLFAEHATDAAHAAVIDVETGNPLHITRGDAERPFLTVRNPSDTPLAWTGALRGEDYFGRTFATRFETKAAPGETARVALPWPLPGRGIWNVRCDLEGSDGSRAVHETAFAFLDRHDVTPFLPKPFYRIGLHESFPPYDEGVRAQTRAALVACGAKILRSNVASFEQIHWEGFDKPHWEAQDRWVAQLRADGIAIDSLIYQPTRWARAPERRNEPDGNRTNDIPPAPGLFRRHCQRIAARYGTKIDYYEIGNEWDLIPKNVFGLDEALRLQREAWEGLKAGCPDACVSVNGWACAVSSEFPPGRAPQPGFIEDFMSRAKGLYDVHAVHLHGSFRNYVPRVANLKRMRKELGIESVPWFSNETAMSRYGGLEKEVATVVWKKPLYAWAHGSTDYIWYNLRATGWDAAGVESAYGLMTADWHPRAGYAAFSALTALAEGLVADGILFEEGNDHDGAARFAFRVRSPAGAAHRRIVLFGWDGLDVAVEPVRVKTDAARAETVDLMGNRRVLPVADGTVLWTPGVLPTALALEGAETADATASARRPRAPKTVSHAPVTVTLDTVGAMRQYYEADPDPASLARLWKDARDLSAVIRYARVGDSLVVDIDVTDDIDAAPRAAFGPEDGDSATVEIRDSDGNVRRTWATRLGRDGTHTRYRAEIRLPSGGGVAARTLVYENDGLGADGYLHHDWIDF